MNPNYEDDIGFTTWFKTISLPDYVGGGKKTVVWCTKCGLYNEINHIELHSNANNILQLKCAFYPKSHHYYDFGILSINNVISSFVCEYNIDPNTVKTTPQFVEVFNFIKTLE